jgi:predicted MFS family arabinose efflux permease
VSGLALSRLVDVYPRRYVLGFAVLAWNGFTVVTALAKGFGLLVVGRVGLGAFEALCSR